jgi:hypothetical protein
MSPDDADESSTEFEHRTRRDVLASDVAEGYPTESNSRTRGVTDDEPAIPAPFDAIPTLDDAPDDIRSLARVRFPPAAVSDEGVIPDPHHHHITEHEITVPEWGLEAARWRLQRRVDCEDDETAADTPAELPRWRVEGVLMGYAQLCEQFVTPDGGDAVAAVLEALEEGAHVE